MRADDLKKELRGTDIGTVSEEAERFHGFDYVRVFFAVTVVAGHSGIFNLISGWPLLHYWFFHYSFLLAVPAFFQLSLYLYIRRAYVQPEYYKKRIWTLFLIYIFWWPINLLLTGMPESLYLFLVKKQEPLSSLLMGNHTLMYFVFDLILFVTLSEILIRLNVLRLSLRLLLLGLTGACAVMVIGRELFHQLFGLYLGYAIPFNFIPYVFSSFVLLKIENDFNSKKIVLACLACTLLFFAIAEYLVHTHNASLLRYTYFEYARISLVAASMLIVFTFRYVSTKPPWWIVRFSELTLGIYVAHSLTLFVVRKTFSSFNYNAHAILVFVMTLSLTVFMCSIMKYRSEKII